MLPFPCSDYKDDGHMAKNRLNKTSFMNQKTRIIVYGFIFLFVYLVIIITPFFYLLVSSLKDMGQYYKTSQKEVWLPWPLHFENYAKAVQQIPLMLYMMNNIVLSVSRTVLSIFSSAIIAYGFSRFNFKGREILFIVVLATMMLPTQVTNIPLYMFFRVIKWTNTFLPLIVPNLFGSAWNVFLIRQFMISIPKEMDEAAQMDGCGSFRLFYKIILPQSIPAIIVAFVFTFMWCWKDLWGPLIFINKSIFYTLPLGLLFFESPTDFQYTVQLAAVVIALVPTVLFYVFGNRYMERGINIADIKG
jgi:multiple sugar transport system permease protein